ncbi:MAG: ATP-grasp domain-containing protein [Desulfosporosinus sp.]
MKLFEYEAKALFKKEGIPVPEGIVIDDTIQINEAVKQVGLPAVLKSQLLMGGRGKAGLIRIVNDIEEAKKEATKLFTSKYNVRKVLFEQAVSIEKEIYLSIMMDPVKAKASVMACGEGGIDIEEIATNFPEKIVRENVDVNIGLMDYQARNIAYSLGLEIDNAKKLSTIISSLYRVFKNNDAELVEINPLFISKSGNLLAGDGKISIDDNSIFRHEFKKTKDYFQNDIEYEAYNEGIPYVQFEGDISLMCAGAGLATTVYDLVNYAGGSVANYLEFGGPNYKKAYKAMELCLKNNSKVILIVTFGTIARADVMAEGIVDAINRLKPDRPIVTCIRGTNEEKGYEILKNAGLVPLMDTEDAVKKAVDISFGRSK